MQLIARLHEIATKLAYGSDAQQTTSNFLYGDAYPQPQAPNEAATQLLARLNLAGDDWEVIDRQSNTLVLANATHVFKLLLQGASVDYEPVANDLAAKVYAKGRCNDTDYLVCDRLNTRQNVMIEDLIPFLFRARDAGFVYPDPGPRNFGYDEQGILKATDHKHFYRIADALESFEQTLLEALAHKSFKDTKFPLVTFDDAHTYVVLDPKPQDIAVRDAQQRRLLAMLGMLGIDAGDIETINQPPVFRIPRTEVTVGTPPEPQALADVLEQGLRIEPRLLLQAENAQTFRDELAGILTGDARTQGLAESLPVADALDAMDRAAFLKFCADLVDPLRQPGACPEAKVEQLDKVVDDYFKIAYPPKTPPRK